MRTQDAKRIPMRDLLSKLGHEPVSEKAGDVWYRSPLRPEETKPSFHVKEAQNVFYDFGLGAGGNVIDFAMRYFHTNSVGSALRHLDDLYGGNPVLASVPKQEAPVTSTRVAANEQGGHESSKMQVQKVQPLQHWGLLDYVKKRGIDPTIARMYLKEIYYTVREGQAKPYFALAFPNRTADSFELRNSFVKGCIGKKDLSLVQPPQPSLPTVKPVCVFEGFMDFLSFLTWQKKRQTDGPVIVLNGIPMGERAIQLLREMGAAEVTLYLDHDAPGRELTQRFQAELQGVKVEDASKVYEGYNDFNDYLQAKRQNSMAL